MTRPGRFHLVREMIARLPRLLVNATFFRQLFDVHIKYGAAQTRCVCQTSKVHQWSGRTPTNPPQHGASTVSFVLSNPAHAGNAWTHLSMYASITAYTEILRRSLPTR
uniref:Uncharacterized protein n=1 Tax=Schistocephalus solidus TaxID=70667 RepID=A0A0V0J6Y7_SCHSO